MKERRKSYHVHPAAADGLSVRIHRGGAEPIPAEVKDLTAGGMGLFLSRRHRETLLSVGEVMQLEVSAAELKVPIILEAVVRRRSELEGGMLYGLEFRQSAAFLAWLPPRLLALFNQRSGPRAKPAAGDTVEVVLQGRLLPEPVAGTLLDISPDGLSLQVPYRIENLLVKVEQVHLSFRLPGSSDPLEMEGRIVHRRTVGRGIRYGIIFDRKRTGAFEAKREAIAAYVQALLSSDRDSRRR